MIRFVVYASLPAEKVDFQDGYERLHSLISDLRALDPFFSDWHEIPHNDNKRAASFFDKEIYLNCIRENVDNNKLEFPGLPHEGSFASYLATAKDQDSWLEDGSSTIDYVPAMGLIKAEVYRPIGAFGSHKTLEIAKGFTKAISKQEGVDFISVDAHSAKTNGKRGFDMYMMDRQLFPHRRWLGWMGFVPHIVEPKHLPEAASLIPVGTKGTVIVAVDECFDLNNPAHLKRAHQVEARMAHVGLLDVTDTSLLS
ncbi:Imm52 family immunity protein [Xanthomonas oryzae]|uniref:Imm52 family immunity protein n=1 Tax=Xanthomonas oryzae TaxID=347 RepID=UPI003D17FECE